MMRMLGLSTLLLASSAAVMGAMPSSAEAWHCSSSGTHVMAEAPITLWGQTVGRVTLRARSSCTEYQVSYVMFDPGFNCQANTAEQWGCGFAMLKDFNTKQNLPWGFCAPQNGQRSCTSSWTRDQYRYQTVSGDVVIRTPWGNATGTAAKLD